ncbi:MAG: SulP family inorganic anion transporter [Gemmatimonadetes bacterium]|nr:SulP family inorganic anion transporter [Candidatus Palauibacter rhopaloidicola]
MTASSPIRSLASEFSADILSPKAVPALAAGFTSGLGLVAAQVAFGSLIFSGALAPYSSQGVGLVLFGNFAACLVIALAGGFRGAISGLSPALVIVMALIGATMQAEGEALFVTAVAALVIGAVSTGVCFLLIGRYRLANLVRFVPYPVAGGFVTGIGLAVCLSAMSMMGADPDWRAIPALVQPSELWKWSPGAAFGIVLYLAMKRWGHPLILPASVVVGVGGFHVVLATLGVSGEEARGAGLLLTSTAQGGLWPSFAPRDLGQVDWAAMATQLPTLLALVLVALIVVIMNLAGLEMAANEDLDWDREFSAAGLASVVAGLGGGTAASMIVPASLRSKLFGAGSRLTGVVTALVIAAAVFLGGGMLELVPVPLVGGMLFFAGAGMLDQGLVMSRKRLPWSEYGLIVLIGAVIVAFGLLEAVGAGMLATLMFFTVRLSRVDPIESRFTARERSSTRARSVPDRAILLDEGERVLAYRLRGYVFFGSVYPLADQLKESLSGDPRPNCLILDLGDVSGFDYSAVNVLARFVQSANAAGVRVVLSEPSAQLKAGLERNLPASEFAAVRIEPNADRALEYCEETVIAAWKAHASAVDERRASLVKRAADDLERHLERQIHFEELMDELRSWLNPRRYAAGEALAGPEVPSEGLQLFTSGRASAHDAGGRRSRQYGPGDAIWPVDPSDDEAPTVTADGSCETMLLTPPARHSMEELEERLALKLYRYLLAGRFEVGAGSSLRDDAGQSRSSSMSEFSS